MGRENLRAVHSRFLPHEAKSYSGAKGEVKPGAKVEATTIPFFSYKPMLKCQKEVGNAGKCPKSEAKL